MTATDRTRPVALVTGHNGFIGRALMRTLLEAGWHSEGLTDPAGTPVDLRDAQAVAASVVRTNPTIIYHLGGVSGPMQFTEDAATVLRVNIEGTQNVLDAAADAGIGRVVIAGSVAGYATAGPSGPEPASTYGLTKRVAELQANLWARQTGGEVTVLRIGSVYGPGRVSANPMREMVEQARREGHISVAPHRMEPCIEIRSCAALIAGLAGIASWRPRYDVVTDRPFAEDVAALIAGMTGAQVKRLDARPLPPHDFPENFDVGPLLADTGLTSVVSLRDGLRTLVDALVPAV